MWSYFTGLHAREWISSMTNLQMLHKIATNCVSNCDVDYYFAPMSNPDGYEYSRTTDRSWRKNRSPNGGSKCQGVDLNRNWDVEFGVGASDNSCSDTYMGPKPFSEPETAALSKAMRAVKNMKLMVSLHSYGQTLLYPWGFTAEPPSNIEDLKAAGFAFQRAAASVNGGQEYSVENSAGGLYFASGATDDWAMKKLGVPYSYTLELRDNGLYRFNLPTDQIKPTADEAIAGFEALISEIKSIESRRVSHF